MSHKKSNIERWADSKVALLGDGMLASAMVEDLNSHALAFRQELPSSKFDFKQFSRKLQGIDFLDFKALGQLLAPYNVIINCIAHTNTRDNTKDTHWDINYRLPAFLAAFCESSGKKLVHISTDYVYAGSCANASEEDVCVPFNNWYSVTKHLADHQIQLIGGDYLIVRSGHKPSPFPFQTGYTNIMGNFQSAYAANEQLQHLLIEGATGVYNIGCSRPKSIYAYGLEEMQKWGIDEKITPENYRGHEVPIDTSMSTSKYELFIQMHEEKTTTQ